MDMGTANLDVRDLLSTAGDLDPSSPLSAPDLRLLIDRLQIHSSSIKARARAYLLSHRHDLASALSRAADGSFATSSLSDSLSTALQLLTDRPLDLEIRALADQIVTTRRELRERKEALGIVTEISRFLDRIRFVREGTRSERVVEAAKTVCELKSTFIVHKKGDDEPLVFDMLRNEWRECFDEVSYLICSLMSILLVIFSFYCELLNSKLKLLNWCSYKVFLRRMWRIVLSTMRRKRS